jgi:hypothetical protein
MTTNPREFPGLQVTTSTARLSVIRGGTRGAVHAARRVERA